MLCTIFCNSREPIHKVGVCVLATFIAASASEYKTVRLISKKLLELWCIT